MKQTYNIKFKIGQQVWSTYYSFNEAIFDESPWKRSTKGPYVITAYFIHHNKNRVKITYEVSPPGYNEIVIPIEEKDVFASLEEANANNTKNESFFDNGEQP